MGRHADPTVPARRPAPVVLIAAGVVAALLAGGLVWWLAGSGEACEDTRTVRVTVAPELGGVARDLLTEPLVLEDGSCVQGDVVAQEPLQTVANLGALSEDSLPAVWVPDSSLWRARTTGVELDAAGSFAFSPIVLATNQAAVDSLGWGAQPPTWAQVLAAGRPLAVPDLGANIEALSAMAAVRESLGGGEAADNAVVQVALTAARGTIPAPAEAIAAAVEGGAGAPLGALSEQEVLSTNAGAGNTPLVAIYPADGSPVLDYPVLRVGRPAEEQRRAVDAVVDVLASDAALQLARRAGFRGPDGAAPLGELTGVQETPPTELVLDAASVQNLLSRLSGLAVPSRLLTVMDVSTSMEAPVGSGTRATLARDAAKSALTLLPDSAAVGLWVFASRLDGDTDWAELAPVRVLAADVDGVPQRQVLSSQLDTIPDRLAPGGTSLYDTTLAAVRAAREDYDADFVNTVVVITDGKNEDDAGIALPALLEALQAEADPDRPVRVVGIALGADADLSSLEQIAAATGASAYSALDPRDLQQVLYSALGSRD